MANVKVDYAKLSDILGTTNASISTIFRESGEAWSSKWHNGVDIAAASGTPIKAAADGVVVNTDTVANDDGFGNRVILKHPDGRATVYAHMFAPAPVKVGQSVKRGQVIGKVGNTGKSYGAHLHLTMLDNYDRNPNIYYLGDLLDPILVCGLGTLKFGSLAKSVIVENGVKKDLGNLNKYYGTVSTGTATVTKTADSAKCEFKIGDIVNFTGTTHYGSSDRTRGKACKPGKAKVTRIANGTAHPIHLVNDGSSSTVYGWVNAEDVQSVTKKTVDEIVQEVIRGDWGNGDERKKRLTEAGYDYNAVQKRVEELMK